MICDNSNAVSVFYKLSTACPVTFCPVINMCEKLAGVFINAFIKLHISGKTEIL